MTEIGRQGGRLVPAVAVATAVACGGPAANQPVEEADCGRTVPPEDPAALAEAIRSLAACTPAERVRLGANGRAYVERHHSYSRLGGELAEILVGDRR